MKLMLSVTAIRDIPITVKNGEYEETQYMKICVGFCQHTGPDLYKSFLKKCCKEKGNLHSYAQGTLT
jgi:hypothetical protein